MYVQVTCVCSLTKYVYIHDLRCGKSKRCAACANKIRLSNVNAKRQNRRPAHLNGRWRGLGPIPAGYFYSLESGAQKRKITFAISQKDLFDLWLTQEGRCRYTDINLCFKTRSDKGTRYGFSNIASLDRIDPRKGYTADNIQWVCKTINTMKWTLTHTEFMQTLNLVKETLLANRCPVLVADYAVCDSKASPEPHSVPST